MRKKLIFILTLVFVIAMLSVLTACDVTSAGGASNNNPPAQNGENIAANGKAVKSVQAISKHEGYYVLGEDIDLKEIEIKITYADDTSDVSLANDLMLDDKNRALFYTVGINTVVFEYLGQKAFLQITVVNPEKTFEYTATFFSNGGSAVENQHTDLITVFVNPTKEGYLFDGWYVNADLTGDRAIAPYAMLQDTVFYAKWVDRRMCNVKFYDGDILTYDFDVVYGTGIDITDIELYKLIPPDDPDDLREYNKERLGKRFVKWKVRGDGSHPEEIIKDTVIEALYETIQSIVMIEVSEDIKRSKQFSYGDTFLLSKLLAEFRLEILEKPGNTARWVIYEDGNPQPFEVDTYGRDGTAPDDGEENEIKVKDINLTFKTEYTINTYTVSVFDAAPDQSKTDLKNGHIELAEKAVHQAIVEYDSDFDLLQPDLDLDLENPSPINGYTGEWCYVVPISKTEERWFNKYRKEWIYDINTKSLTPVEDSLPSTSADFILQDNDGNYIANVSDGNLKQIQGNVVLKPRYEKIVYTVTLRREDDGKFVDIGSFQKEYLSDFCLYNPDEYPEGHFPSDITGKEIEYSYHKNSVPEWTFGADVKDRWTDIYSNGNADDDFAVKWYGSADRRGEEIIFLKQFVASDQSVTYEYVNMEITDDIVLYCKDVDLRNYTVTIYYSYDFSSTEELAINRYRYNYKKVGLTETEEFEIGKLCPDYNYAVTRNCGKDENGEDIILTYEFDGWYDFPYDPDYTGSKKSNDDFRMHRTRNGYYYAHYKCTSSYTIKIYDKTQEEAYNGKENYEGKHYDVPKDSIIYTVPAGTKVTYNMLFKGRPDEDGGYKLGQYYYEMYAFINYYDGEYTDFYNENIGSLGAYGSKLSEKTAKKEAYLKLLDDIYNYRFEKAGITEDYFNATYMSVLEYQTLCKDIQNLTDKIELLNKHDEYKKKRDDYVKDNADDKEGGLFKKYSDSYRDLNAAFGHNVDNNDYKYEFSGWYTDEAYSKLYSSSEDFSWFAWKGDIELYAKWADIEKGSEGLVFRKATDESGEVIGWVVVGFIDSSDYENPENVYMKGDDYSINLSDQGNVPVSLGTKINLQIPASHGLSNLPVIGIVREAFMTHSADIEMVSLPQSLRFVEEGAFSGCSLISMSISENRYIAVDNAVALYQIADYTYFVKGDGPEVYIKQQAKAGTLIVYAASSVFEEYTVLKDYRTTVEICEDVFTSKTNQDIYIRYDDSNPFGMMAGKFDNVYGIPKHTNKSVLSSTVSAFDSLGELFAAYVANSFVNYVDFYNKAKEIFYLSYVPFTLNACDDITKSAIIGLKGASFTAGFDVSGFSDIRDILPYLFGFSNLSDFVGYADALAALCAEYRTDIENSVTPCEALENGAFFTKDGYFIFPIAIQSSVSSPVLTYIIVDNDGNVSVWINDLDAAIEATAYKNNNPNIEYRNELYGKNMLFIYGFGTIRIGDDAFYLARNLKIIDFNTESLESIGRTAFSKSGLTGTEESGIVLPSSLKVIGSSAFDSCLEISDVSLADPDKAQLITVDEFAFSTTGWYLKQRGIVVLNGILLGVRPVSGENYDKNPVGINKTADVLTEAGVVSAYYYTNDYGVIYYSSIDHKIIKTEISDNVTSIAIGAFRGLDCDKQEIVIPSTVKRIETMAFRNCSVKRIIFRDGADCYVDAKAFYECAMLTAYFDDAESAQNGYWGKCINLEVKQYSSEVESNWS